MKKNIKTSLITLGVVSIVCAVLGLLYNTGTAYAGFSGAFAKIIKEYRLLYFYQAFYAMSAICVAFYILLLLCGIYFLKLQNKFTYLFMGVMVAEVLYFLFLRFMVSNFADDYAHSIAAAAGVANGGLMAQYFILFPIWGGILALWIARKSQDKHLTTGSTADRD
jgi:hypothetical protein